METVQLSRNLRKNVLRGHPWVYGEALERTDLKQSQMVKIKDGKGDFLGWGIFDPQNDIKLRVLSTEQKPPGIKQLRERLSRALDLRSSLVGEATNCMRLVNGEGDYLPGLVVDRYHNNLVVQFDGHGMAQFWLNYPIVDWLIESLLPESIVHKSRHLEVPEFLLGRLDNLVEVRENRVKFLVDIIHGQKTGFFLDQRDNRQHLSLFTQGKRVLNLFSYTGGFSMYAGRGGASHVTSVDIAAGAIENCQNNWVINELSEGGHTGVAVDCHEFLQSSKEKWDVIVVDPPSMAPSEKAKTQAIEKYIKIFSLAAKKLTPSGDLFLSSCSSHISFQDFSNIVDESLAKARRTGQVLRVSGQGIDHPYPHYCPEMRYLKFYHLKVE